MGYQDTLYVHSNRQFFRECNIYGTVDFIFGNAAVVLQNCSIYARKPMASQKNTITAQNRKDPNQNTGISIHACRILAGSDLAPSKGSFPTYLGRPWKALLQDCVHAVLHGRSHPSERVARVGRVVRARHPYTTAST
ncbi:PECTINESTERASE/PECTINESTERASE INHIBITOR 61-RELATED [Salix viminalis]|uniref:Pectinesterase n=1 Tax=Salix viminalis TaxID=40686 RepID=A0A9Q0NNC9_SALVM|nr:PECTINESTERASE/PECTINESTERASE INHIBITOR 61-RELATED [Salix viminalis]